MKGPHGMSAQPGPFPPVVTLFETYGAGATQIGARVAAALGVPFVGQRFASEDIEAGKMKVYEDGPIGRFLAPFGVYSPNPEGAWSTATGQAQDYEAVRQNHLEVLEAAETGVVVLGRNATAILADRAGALHVKLIGQLADRLARAARVDGIDPSTAARRQKNEDRARAQLTRQLYHWDATDPLSFDLVLNTSRLDEQACADTIVAAWQAKATVVAASGSRAEGTET
ncbi:MAG TPA: cytidylate kinase-like family protein [Jatrophihabitantaceae bacterium]|nr:cytidylate kinase-like family protein [Jatrophihabitantaceae bacterium]